MNRRIQHVALVCMGLALWPLVAKHICQTSTASTDSSGREDSTATIIVDIDGNTYRTVRIGTQVWMAENLRVTRYRDGTAIPKISNSDMWSAIAAGAYCLPERDSLADEEVYGLLYNFLAVSDSCLLCPDGWHVPTAGEWRTLIDYLGGTEVAGGKMKDVISGLWRTPVPGSSNESGFSAVPAGGRGRFGAAAEAGYYATWWSSTPHDSVYAWHWGLYPDKNGIRSNPGHKSSGFSVRCIKD